MLEQKYLTFIKVAQLGSYTKAAKQLFISQPAVSQQLTSLENELGVKLFTYHNRQLKLTCEGEKLLTYVQSLKVQTDKFITNLHHPSSLQTSLTIATTMSLANEITPNIIAKIQANNTFTKLNCKIANTKLCLESVQAGKVDFALIEGNFPKEKFSSHIITEEKFIPVCSPLLGLNAKQTYRFSDLLDYPIIYREEGSGSYNIFKTILASRNIAPSDFKFNYQVGSPTAIKALLLKGLGISFIYQTVAKHELATKQLIPIKIENLNITHPIYLVYSKNSYFAKDYLNIIGL